MQGRRNMARRLCHRQLHAKGFTLVETMIAVAIIAIVSLGLIFSVITARQIAEYDKQRIVAVSAARIFLEQRTRRDPFPKLDNIPDMPLDNFNTPDTADDLSAKLNLHLYHVNTNGTRGAELTSNPTADDVLEAVVTVTWKRLGSHDATVSEELHTYVAPDLSSGS